MTERPVFPGTDHGPFGPPVRPQQPTPRISASFGMGDFPGTRSNPFGADRPPVKKSSDSASARWGMADFPGTQRNPFGNARKLEKGIPVNPVMEDLKDLFVHEGLTQDFSGSLRELVANWKSTDRVKSALVFGDNYHQNGSLKSALEAVSPDFSPAQVSVAHGENTVTAGLYGIIGRRKVHLPKYNEDRTLFDCIVDTEEGLTLATMSYEDRVIRFRFRRGFKPGQPRKHAIEDIVIPTCKK